MGRIVEFSSGFPGYDATMPKANGFLSEILGDARLRDASPSASGTSPPPTRWRRARAIARWPLGRGFDRFYGFIAGETDQYHPDLVHDNHQIDPPRTPDEGYHLTEDLADHAISYITDLRAASPDRPFFLYFTPGACHAPHQVPKQYRERYRGRFDLGWDRWREEIFARQTRSPDCSRPRARS